MADLVTDDLAVFATFARHRNFTRAAEELHVSQPAVHVRIKKLERRLGEPLYVRRGRGLDLTPAGTRLAAFANDAVRRAEEFLLAAERDRERPLALAAGSGAYLYLLDGALRTYLSSERRLRLVTADAGATVAAVREGAVDLGITALDVPPADLDARPLARVAQVAVLPPGHRLAGRDEIGLRDLDGESLVLPPRDRPHRRALEARLAEVGGTCAVALEAQGWDLLVQFAALGAGVTVVNASVRLPDGATSVPIRDLAPVRYVSLARPERADDERLTDLRDALHAGVAG